MSGREQILQLLRGPVAGRIRFTFPGAGGTVTISPVSFRHVASNIESGHIKIVFTHDLDPGVGGEYISGTPNTLRVQPILGRSEEGLILHECTHAVFDVTRTPVVANDDEAASYVVDALYFRMTGLPHPRWNVISHARAGEVADLLLKQYAQGTVGIPAVDPTAWTVLKATVMFRPNYRFGRAGFLGTLLGQQYPHDG
jgi:hypothetical protein